MFISQENKDELILKCADLISKTLVELGQFKSDGDIAILANSLADDIKRDFGNIMFMDIQNAFSNGVRHTDLFSINVKTYYKWIKTWRQIIWDARDEVENKSADPRTVLHYRPEPKLLTNK
jgi:hypothetical protein